MFPDYRVSASCYRVLITKLVYEYPRKFETEEDRVGKDDEDREGGLDESDERMSPGE